MVYLLIAVVLGLAFQFGCMAIVFDAWNSMLLALWLWLVFWPVLVVSQYFTSRIGKGPPSTWPVTLSVGVIVGSLLWFATAYWNVPLIFSAEFSFLWAYISTILYAIALPVGVLRYSRSVQDHDAWVRSVLAGSLSVAVGFLIFLAAIRRGSFDPGAALLAAFVVVLVALVYHLRQLRFAFLVGPAIGLLGGAVLFAFTLINLPPAIGVGILGLLVAGTLCGFRKQLYQGNPFFKYATRGAGLFLMAYAITPLVIFILLGVKGYGFLKTAQAKADKMSEQLQKISGDAEGAAMLVNDFMTEESEKIDKLKADVEKLSEQIPTAEMKELAEKTSQAFSKVGEIPSAISDEIAEEVDLATADARKIANQVSDELGNMFKLPDIDLGFMGDISFPDLGIGEALKNMFSNMLPNFNLTNMFSGYFDRIYKDIVGDLGIPVDRIRELVTAIQEKLDAETIAKLEANVEADIAALAKIPEEMSALADALHEQEQHVMTQHVGPTFQQLCDFGRETVIFFYFLALAVAVLLVHSLVGIFVRMFAQLKLGWSMVTYSGEEAVA